MKGKVMGRPMNIAVDFDGTIAEYDGYKGCGVFGAPIAGVAKFTQEVRKLGHRIIIWTCRAEHELIAEYLEQHGIHFDLINDNHPDAPKGVSEKKITADLYIDDRGFRFDGDWDDPDLRGLIDGMPIERLTKVNGKLNCGWHTVWPCSGKTVCGVGQTHVYECSFLEATEYRNGEPVHSRFGYTCDKFKEV